VGVSGNYYFVNYGSVAGTPGISGFIDSRSASGAGFYAHRFSNRHWIGATYSFQQLMFDPGGRTTVHRALGFYSLILGPHMALSLWAGPQYSTTFISTVLVAQPSAGATLALPAQWSPTGGVMYSWEGSRTSLHAGYSRLISDGSGVTEAVTSQQADAEFRRRLAARWTATAGVAYARNNPLRTLSKTAPLRSFQGNAGIGYRLTDNLGIDLSYGRQQQQYEYVLLPSATASQNRVWFSLSYIFARPLGR
jgi:opacity protein-like surface antigen